MALLSMQSILTCDISFLRWLIIIAAFPFLVHFVSLEKMTMQFVSFSMILVLCYNGSSRNSLYGWHHWIRHEQLYSRGFLLIGNVSEL